MPCINLVAHTKHPNSLLLTLERLDSALNRLKQVVLTAFLSQCLFCDTAGLVTVTWLFLFNAQFLVWASCNQRKEIMKVLHLSTHVAACMWFQGWKRILDGVGCLHFCRLIKAFYWIVLRLRGFIYKYGESAGHSKILYATLKNDPRSVFLFLWLLGLFFCMSVWLGEEGL